MKNFTQTTDFNHLDLRRIAVIGCSGSGKTTFANALGKALGREVIHLDKLLWEPDWQTMPYERRRKIHDELVRAETWLIDGMWRSHLADRYDRATTVIFLDYPRRVCLSRVVKRRLKFAGKQREDIADGCLEKLDGYFLRYIWNFRRKVRPLILQLSAEHSPNVCTVTLNSPKQAKKFLDFFTDREQCR